MQQGETTGRDVAKKKAKGAKGQDTSGPPQPSTGTKPHKQKKRYQHDIFRAWCKQCGICVAFCPMKVLAQDEFGYPYAAQPEACIGCHQCELRCPDFAITVVEEQGRAEDAAPSEGVEAGAKVA